MFLLAFSIVRSQEKKLLSWVPGEENILGRGRINGFEEKYDRLARSASGKVRKEVWDLSKHAAGLYLRFRTNAQEIIVQYTLSGSVQMPHMPATGVSGVDLYSRTEDGQWNWHMGRYVFGDTVRFSYTGLPSQGFTDHFLYLPLYNHVKWLEIRYPEGSGFEPYKFIEDKPIVIYGTSIAQGGCASRPGLGWTNILARKLGRSVVNLAFSGNGRLEQEVLDHVADIDASMFVLDCLPNMASPTYINGELRARLVHAVRYLKEKRPGVPILLTDHSGYMDEVTNPKNRKIADDANQILASFHDSLLRAGVKQVDRLKKDEIGLDIESTVDGVHPNDIGMMRLAEAYTKKIREIDRKSPK